MFTQAQGLITWVILIIFLVEAVLRRVALGERFWKCKWNVLDTWILAVTCPCFPPTSFPHVHGLEETVHKNTKCAKVRLR